MLQASISFQPYDSFWRRSKIFLRAKKISHGNPMGVPWDSHGKSEIPKTIISNITIRCIAYQLRLWIGFVYVFQTCISAIPYKSHKKGTFTPLKEVFFFGKWNELFWQKRFEPAVIVVWPWELVRLIGNCLENIFITYHMVIRRLEKFLRACEVQIQIFWHLK